MNWKDNVTIYEQLHEISNSISAGYSMLAYNFKNHVEAKRWEANAKMWNEYWHKLTDLVLSSEEEANREITKLYDKMKELKDIEKDTYFLQ
jgi:hypothetical protein